MHNVTIMIKNDDYYRAPTFCDLFINSRDIWVPIALAAVGLLMVFPAKYYFEFLRVGEAAQKEDLATAHYILMAI